MKKSDKITLQDDIDEIKEALGDAVEHTKERASRLVHDSYDNVIDKSTDLEEVLIEYVKKKPLKSLGMALLAGAVIGRFILK